MGGLRRVGGVGGVVGGDVGCEDEGSVNELVETERRERLDMERR